MKIKLIISLIVLNSIFVMAQSELKTNPVGSLFKGNYGEMPEGTYKFISGGYEVYTIASSDKSYQPASLYYGENDSDKPKVEKVSTDSKIPTAMNCFIVKTPEGYIMFDTGLPSSNGGKTIERMKSLGISPEDIKAIYITHGHFDHIGGLVSNDGTAGFPYAKVYISEPEIVSLRQNTNSAFQQIEKNYDSRLEIFQYGEILPNNILPISAKGHTPGHTAFRLGNLLFVGDLMHGQALQMIDPTICAAFDADRFMAIATRKAILSYAATNSLTVIGSHIPQNGIIF